MKTKTLQLGKNKLNQYQIMKNDQVQPLKNILINEPIDSDWEIRFQNIMLRIGILIFLSIIGLSCMNAQYAQIKRKTPLIWAGGVEGLSPANGHGLYYAPYLALNHGRNMVSIGPALQYDYLKLNGFKLTYSRNLSAPSLLRAHRRTAENMDLVQLNCFVHIQYNNASPLSADLIREVRQIQRDRVTGVEKARPATGQAGAGFEVQLNISKHLAWKSSVGASVYNHFGCTKALSCEKIAPVLSLGTGIHILFN